MLVYVLWFRPPSIDSTKNNNNRRNRMKENEVYKLNFNQKKIAARSHMQVSVRDFFDDKKQFTKKTKLTKHAVLVISKTSYTYSDPSQHST